MGVFKASGAVTLLGDTSGGGSGVVRIMSSAWGSLYTMSGIKRISFVKNGSFYDREQLTEFINSLR